MSSDDPAYTVYEQLAAAFAERQGNREIRTRHGEWTVFQELLPELDSTTLLDAGCGTGACAQWLADQGASVTGIDASMNSLAEARARTDDNVAFAHADLTKRLPFGGDTFDVVVCCLVLEHIENWDHVMAEFARVLVSGGTLVVSTDHPFTTYHVIHNEPADIGSAVATKADYYAVEGYTRDWGSCAMPCYRRPLEAMLRPIADADFAVTAIREPKPQARTEHTEYFIANTPRFCAIKARTETP